MLDQLSYIIPIRLIDPARQRNLAAITDWLLSRFAGIQVVVVEHDTAPKLRITPGGDELMHVFLQGDAPFDKGAVINAGVARTSRPYLALGDADVAVSTAQLTEAVRLLQTHDAVKPYHRAKVIDLDETQTLRFAEQLDVTGLQGTVARGLTNFAGGLFCVRRDFFASIGGFPEGFRGWGGEDDAMGLLLERHGRCVELPTPCVHLSHPRTNRQNPHFIDNLRRVLSIANA